MNSTVPPAVFRALPWIVAATFIALAVLEWRSGSVYQAIVSLGVAGLNFFTSKGPRPTWGVVLLLILVLVYGTYRLLSSLALLKGA